MSRKTSKGEQRRSGSIATVVWLRDRRPLGLHMHGKQLGSADVLAFPLERLHQRRPRRRRDLFPLLPLGDSPVTLANVSRHLSDGVPAREHISDRFHVPEYKRYKLSRPAIAGFPVLGGRVAGDNSRMGRARSPVQFNKDIAARTKAARIAAGFGDAREFAEKHMGVGYERYKKWEGGRTPIQHEYVPRFYELTGKDANYLFDIKPAKADQERRSMP